MSIPSFDEFLATLSPDEMKEILSKVNEGKFKEYLSPNASRLDEMSAISLASSNICISLTFILLRRYHEWLTKFLQ